MYLEILDPIAPNVTSPSPEGHSCRPPPVWTFAHVDPLGYIACVSMNDDGRSMSPNSRYRDTSVNLS